MKSFRLFVIVFVLACIFGSGIFLGTLFRKAPPPVPQIQNTATILRQVQALSELVTVKYVLEKVVVLEDTKWYGENKVVLIAHGIAKAGIDLKDLKIADMTVSEKKIVVKLPSARMSDAYLDDRRTQVLERSTGFLRTFDKNLEQNARQQAQAAILKAARELGITKDAEEKARMQLANFFHQMGFTEVEFRERTELPLVSGPKN